MSKLRITLKNGEQLTEYVKGYYRIGQRIYLEHKELLVMVTNLILAMDYEIYVCEEVIV